MLWNEFDIAEIEGFRLWLSRIEICKPLKQAPIVQTFLKPPLNNHYNGPNHRHAHWSSIFMLISSSAKVEILRVSFPHCIKQTALSLQHFSVSTSGLCWTVRLALTIFLMCKHHMIYKWLTARSVVSDWSEIKISLLRSGWVTVK